MSRDPQDWSLFTWILCLIMGTSGGFVNWYARVKSGLTKPSSVIELVGEIFTSGFVGVGVFMALASFDQPTGFCAASAGVSGHMATRLLYAVERLIERKINALSDE